MSIIWTAEIGSCHQGSRSLAYELIRQAKWAGATIAKFQLGWTKEAQAKYCSSYDERRYVDDWADDLAKWCADLDIEFMASIWSMEGLEVARSVGMKRYKIAHQMNNEELIDEIVNDKKPVFYSTDPSGKNFAHKYQWGDDALTVIRTMSNYPTYELTRIDRNWLLECGHPYSSHMHGIADALIAVSRGAQFIEKHITLSKYAGFPKDASFALTPPEFKNMVEIGDEISRLR